MGLLTSLLYKKYECYCDVNMWAMNNEQMNANNDHDKIFMKYFCHMDKILDYVEIYFAMLTYLMIIWPKKNWC
jgi:hypothetical protein